MTLYDIKGEFLQLYEMATEDDDEQAFLDTLEALKGELEVKAEGYVNIIQQLEMEAEQCSKMQDAFMAKEARRMKSIQKMKEALISAMDVAGTDKLQAGDYELKIVKNGGLAPLKIEDGAAIPDKYMKIIYEPDNKKIRDALEAGEELDFAFIGERGRHLRIK